MIFTNRDTASDGVQADEVLMMHVMYSCRLVHAGQMVQWLQRVQGGRHMQHIAAPPGLHVVYEDADLACIVKPQGMPVAVSAARRFHFYFCKSFSLHQVL